MRPVGVVMVDVDAKDALELAPVRCVNSVLRRMGGRVLTGKSAHVLSGDGHAVGTVNL